MKAVQNSRMYPAFRGVYRQLFMPERRMELARMNTFYAQFFRPGEVVFDVGANYGEYAECFALGGARVVAIEPNPALRPRLEAIARTQPIYPEYVALGDQPGTVTLNICSVDLFSTIASPDTDWIKENPDYTGVEWTHKVDVPVSTADALAEKYGLPSFVKIDVEGFEINVLRGMRFSPNYISFEYGVTRKDIAYDCISLLGARGYRFRPITAKEFRFVTPGWLTGAQAKDWLAGQTRAVAEYGDIFAYLWPA